MKNKIKHYIKEILLFIVVMTIFANVISLYKSMELNKEPLNISNITLINSKQYTIPHAKPILIHIWATWCPTCKLEASNIQTLSKYFEVVTIAVKSGSDDDINKWLKENNYDFKVVNDNNGVLASKFKIAAYPTTLIYNKDKDMVFSEVGYTSTIGLFLRMWWASY